ncbi:MAG: hypothetical protein JXQ75_22265 [Phycisphaerae bacterium]|nr:hypothetical protein [Phycisphaerae bacterium]
MIDPFSQDHTVCVSKRDGSTEPLSFAKMLNCIRNGLEASGEAPGLETGMAAGLAEVVHEYVKKSFRNSAVESRRLAELVDLVLAQTGHTAACMATQQYRSLREQQRRQVMVANPRPSDGRYVRRRWNKSHIVQHLRRRHMLGAPVSRMIAGRVEQLVFNCGLRVVTAGLVCEIIKSELLAWGLLPGALVVKKTRGHREERKITDKSDTA